MSYALNVKEAGTIDGYIKHKKEEITSQRKGILATYCLSFPLIMILATFSLLLCIMQAPKNWQTTQIVYSQITNEHITLSRSPSVVLNTAGGEQFVIPTRQITQDEAETVLVRGGTYTIVYSKRVGARHIEAMYTDTETVVALSDSISQYEKERNEMFVAIGVTIILEVIAVILLDRLACKKLYAEIRKLKQDIARREEKIRKKQEGCQ